MRTRLYVEAYGLDTVSIQIPEIYGEEIILIPKTSVPYTLVGLIHPGFTCRVTVGDVEYTGDLKLTDWGLH